MTRVPVRFRDSIPVSKETK
jgi:serine/threonine protein kinase